MGYKDWDDQDLDWAYIKGVMTGLILGTTIWFVVVAAL